jgi:hypothetical protein
VARQRTVPTTTSTARAGYLAGALGNALLLGALHIWPGWQVLPFLTAETPEVLGAVDAMLVAGIAIDLLHVVRHRPWQTPVGTFVTSAFGLVATVRVLQVFPFAFGPGFDWSPVVRVLLVLGAVGSAIGCVLAVVQMVRLHRLTGG